MNSGRPYYNVATPTERAAYSASLSAGSLPPSAGRWASVRSYRPSFLRTTPARKPRTECCCHSVAVMIVAIVAPAGIRSSAMIRSCLVSGRKAGLDDAGADRLREAGLAVFRAIERVAAFAWIWVWSWNPLRFMRRHPAHHLSPARANHPAGQDPEPRLSGFKST